MSLPMQHIIQHLFNTESLSTVPRERLEALVEEYPSFGVARYLLSRKLHAEGNDQFGEETLKTNLYFSNPYWLQWLMKNGREHDPAAAGLLSAPKPEQAAWAPADDAGESAPAIPEMQAAEEVAFSAGAPDPVVEEVAFSAGEPAFTEEVMPPAEAPAEGPSAADQLLESIAALKLSQQQTAEEIPVSAAADELLQNIAALRLSQQQATEVGRAEDPAPPAEETSAVSMVSMALEQADDHPYEDPDGLPPLPEDSEDSLAPGGLGTRVEEAAFAAATSQETAAEAEPVAEAMAEPVMGAEVEPIVEAAAQPVAGPDLEAAAEPVVAFEPYHTIDYFASQGIKLTLDENPSDKLGRQLKSFTDWLKVMRKLPQKNNEIVPDIAAEHQVRAIAAHSIEGKEIVTETMAEVLVKQGMREKAMEVYRKLSLLNPDKIAYFANKIDQLKID